MFRIALCDDEEEYLEHEEKYISKYLDKLDFDYKITKFTNGFQLVNAMSQPHDFDMIFLDIDMAGLNGIETAKQLRKVSDEVFIVFVTAYVNYSMEGYEARAFRYLLKIKDDFKVRMRECMNAIILEYDRRKNCYFFSFREGMVQLFADEILYVESELHVVTFVVYRNNQLERLTRYVGLNEIEEMLKKSLFCRISQSYLVNIRHIIRMNENQVLMRDGTWLPFSKSRKAKAKEAILGYWGEI